MKAACCYNFLRLGNNENLCLKLPLKESKQNVLDSLMFFVAQCLELTIGEKFIKKFGESDNEKLAQVLFKATIPRMMDYLSKFAAKKHIE